MTHAIKDRIRAEITSNGPMPFERFMEIALYDSDGFFGGQTLRSERGGDFLTSPEVSRLFGETLAIYVEQEHQRIGDPFQVVEVGAGSGSLLRPLLDVYPIEAWAVEASPAARKALDAVLPRDRILAEMPGKVRGVVIANELLDNLPMALAQRVDDDWRERWVGLDEDGLGFVDAGVRQEVRQWLDAYAGDVPEGGWVEVQLAARSWLTEAIERLEAGSVAVIDYGETAENLIPRRSDGTLRTYRSHHLGPHPLDEPGATDITADVNFTALLDVAPRSTLHRQDDFLAELGLRERLSELRRAELEAARAGDEMERLRLRTLKTEAETLLHPRGLGDFRVLLSQKGLLDRIGPGWI
ncbi:MAG: SAM-dependent methyltransferase [Acidimicrobiia bacterium]|nr:SAM-dependent methyltransferase [Acidimicrobiia bacterium]